MRKPITCETLEGRLLLTTTANDTSYASQWGLSAIAASSAWDTTTGSPAVVVADIDTGLDYTHDDLYQNVWINQSEIPSAVRKTLKDADGDGRISFYDLNASANVGKVKDVDKNGRIDAADILTRSRYGGWADGVDEGANGYTDDLIGWDFANNDRNPLDYDGHGTHTAGTIGASGNNAQGVSGVDWHVSIMAVKIFDDQGFSASDRSIAAAIRYSADNGAAVSNNSWGGSGYSTRIYNAIAYAGDKGQLFVVAAGNDGANLDSRFYNDYPSEYALDNIVTVGATSSSGSIAYYSNYGAASVDVFAPGSSVLSTYLGNTYQRMSGTSMAAPHVAGAAALMLAANARLTAAQLKARLIAGADQNASLAARSVAGGELNVANALASTTGTRYTASTSDSGTVVTTPGRRRRFFFSIPVPVDGSPSSPASPSAPATGATGSAATPATAVAVAPPAPQVQPSASTTSTSRAVLATPATSTSANPASPAAISSSATSSQPVAARVFSERRVSPTSAGYEPAPAAVLQFNIDGVPVSAPTTAPRPAQPVVMQLPPAPITDGPSALLAAGYAPAAQPDLLPRIDFGASTDAPTSAPVAVVERANELARLWSAMGPSGRLGAVTAATLAIVTGAYTHLRRKLRTRAASARGADAAKPIELDLHP